jgi:hypothetical protein
VRGQNKSEVTKRQVERSKGEKRNTKPQDFMMKIFEEEPKNLSLKNVQKICHCGITLKI